MEPRAKYCPVCGLEATQDMAFCMNCGASLTGEPTADAASPTDASDLNVGPSFWGAFGYCIKNYCNFEGRATRTEFWGWRVVIGIITGLMSAVFSAFIASQAVNGGNVAATLRTGQIVSLAFSAIFILPEWAVAARRAHDLGASSKGVVAYFVINFLCGYLPACFGASILSPAPLGDGALAIFGCVVFWLSWVATLILGFAPGTKGPNRFGERRLNPSDLLARRNRY